MRIKQQHLEQMNALKFHFQRTEESSRIKLLWKISLIEIHNPICDVQLKWLQNFVSELPC